MASIKNRIEKLEAAVKVQTIKVDFIRIIVEPDGTISEAIQRDGSGKYLSVFEMDSSEI